MKLLPTDLHGVVVVEPQVFSDDRGWFMESFSTPRFEQGLHELGLPAAGPFVQDNQSCSAAGVLRGLHYQLPPHEQGKLVRVVKGRVFDVAVDIRRGSPHFGRWVGVELSAENRRQVWIPPGFAHGLLALEDDTQCLYKATDVYAPQCERLIRWDDAEIGIAWPLEVGIMPRVAKKDAMAPMLSQAETYGLPLAESLLTQ